MVPRAVLVGRPTEWSELLARHGTREQVNFFLLEVVAPDARAAPVGEDRRQHVVAVAQERVVAPLDVGRVDVARSRTSRASRGRARRPALRSRTA